jgi:hypothetical protein
MEPGNSGVHKKIIYRIMKKSLEYHKYPGLFVCCHDCGRNVNHKQSGKKICNHPLDRQFYKALIKIPNTGGERTSKNLSSKTFDEAVKEFLEFKHRVYNPHLYEENTELEKPELLIDAVAMYVDYLHDLGIPHHKKKYLSESHIKTTIQFLKEFVQFVSKKKYDLEKFKLASISDSLVGEYCKYIEDKGNSNYTFNDKIKALKTFFNYLILTKGYPLKNIWKDVSMKSESQTDITIAPKDFYDLLDVISPENSRAQIGKTKRNMFRPWLKDVIMLKAYTGRRNIEVFTMKWNMVKFEGDTPMYIMSPNNKLNQLQNNTKKIELQYAYVPIGVELLDLLTTLGLDAKKNCDEYIIAPEEPYRKSMERFCSKCFSFYFDKLERGYKAQFKHLRQTYVTAEDIFLRRGASMQHSDYRTTAKHYIDRKEIAKDMVRNGFRVFPKRPSKEVQRTLPQGTVSNKKDPANLQGLDYVGGAYRSRTGDLLTASQTL